MVQTRLQSGAQMSNGKRKLDIETEPKPIKKQRRAKTETQESESKSKSPSKAAKTKTVKSEPTAKQNGHKANGIDDDSSSSGKIIINRAPVLQLWAACITQKLHPSLRWSTSLSAGAAISTLCAISKGRAIGAIEPKDKDKAEEKKNKNETKNKNKKREEEELDEIEVMHFHLRIDGSGKAMVGDKPSGPGEDGLKRKFGQDDAYERVKAAFEDALKTWKSSDGEELNGKAFKMYENFRPDVSKGQKGWGRKGELDLEAVTSIVSKS